MGEFPNKATQFQPGNPGGGKPKGARHLSTIIQELEADIDWDLTSLKSKEELSKKYGKNGMKALVMVAFSKAMSGDTKAMDWLARYGYGSKTTLELKNPARDVLDAMKLLEGENGREATEDTQSTPNSAA